MICFVLKRHFGDISEQIIKFKNDIQIATAIIGDINLKIEKPLALIAVISLVELNFLKRSIAAIRLDIGMVIGNM